MPRIEALWIIDLIRCKVCSGLGFTILFGPIDRCTSMPRCIDIEGTYKGTALFGGWQGMVDDLPKGAMR